jgi:hypothetical protein
MTRAIPLLGKLVIVAVLAAGVVGCESTDKGRKKKKVVTAEEFDSQQKSSVSGLPWNRPRAFETGAGMGRMMPQSR